MKYFTLFLISLLLILSQSCSSRQADTTQNRKGADWVPTQTIYELNIRQFSTSGTFRAVENRLAAIHELGITTIWIMPVQPIGQKKRKGSLGSYYSIKDYRAINPEFGSMDDFKELVNKIHQLGMHVIIDWVANHTSWDNPLITAHPDWYTHDSTGAIVSPVADWTDVADLNYKNKALRTYMIESMQYWLRETDVDGFRCDVAEMVPLDFWQQARPDLEKIKPVFLLAEGDAPNLYNQAFDATYSWDLYRLMNKIAKGDQPAGAVFDLLRKENKRYSADFLPLRFTTNHDENSWNGTVFERLGEGAKTFAVLAATLPGIPLLYNGQEAGLNKRLNFFEQDPIIWHVNEFRHFYTRLFTLHMKNPSINAGNFLRLHTGADNFVVAFLRTNGEHKVITVLNLSSGAQMISLHSSQIAGRYMEHFSGEISELETDNSLQLEPWGIRVFVNLIQ